MPLLEQTSTVALPCACVFCSAGASDGVLRLPIVDVSHRTVLSVSNDFLDNPGQASAAPRRLRAGTGTGLHHEGLFLSPQRAGPMSRKAAV